MSILSVFHNTTPQQPNKVLTHAEDIAATLAEHGIGFTQRALHARPRPGGGEQAALQALGDELTQLHGEYGSTVHSLLDSDGEDDVQLWLGDEHAYASQETLVVLSGRLQVTVRCGEWVCAVVCERGDVVQIPGGLGRWMSLGDRPFCVALRLRGREGVSLPVVTRDATAREFPGMDEF